MLRAARQSLARFIAPPTQRRAFDAAGGGRRWSTAQPFGHVGTETLTAVATIRARARHAYANDPYAFAAVESWVTALVGTGARATPSHPDRETRREITAAIGAWSEEADADGRTSWFGLQQSLARALVVDGEALAVMVDTDDGLRVRHLPIECLADEETRQLQGGGCIVAGVEFNAEGERVAYHIRPDVPSILTPPATPVRVDAADVMHVFRPLGAGQVRGLSWLAPVLLKLRELDQLTDALVVQAKVGAMFAGFLKDVNGTGAADMPFDGTIAGSIMTDGLEPGTIKVLPSGWDLTLSSPPQTQQAPQLVAAEIRAVAVGMGVPAHLVSGDLSQANYGSLRADLTAFRQRAEGIQYGLLEPALLRRVHTRAVVSLVLTGRLDAPGFEADPRPWQASEFLFPRPPWIDPQKDAVAQRELLDAGLTSRRKAAAELGWPIEDLDEEIAADRAREKALGLDFTASRNPKPEATNADA